MHLPDLSLILGFYSRMRSNLARMNHFSIKDIENLSGIKAHTLRIWEQRYQLLLPKRKESNHRYYDGDDLRRMLRIARLYHNGVKISRIAHLTPAEMTALEDQLQQDTPTPGDHVHQLIAASLDFDEIAFDRCFERVLKQLGMEQTMLQVVYPFLERIGLLWLTDNALPAQEHFASNIIRRKIIVQIEQIKNNPTSGPICVLFTPEGELHEIPLLLVYYLLKKAGKRCVYLGVDLPVKDLEVYVAQKGPSQLYFNVISHLQEMDMNRFLEQICARFPKQQVIMAGPLTKDITSTPSNALVLRSLEEVIQFSQQ